MLSFTNIYSQEEEEVVNEEVLDSVSKEKINLSQLAELLNSEDKEIIISDYYITSSEQDKKYMIDKVFYSLYNLSPKKKTPKKIYFYNCDFHLGENSPLVFSKWNIVKLNIIGCEFWNPVEFKNFVSIGHYPNLIENCIFHNNITFSDDINKLGSLQIINTDFESELLVDMPLGNLVVENCHFTTDSTFSSSHDDELVYYQFTLGEKSADNIKLNSNIFKNNGVDNVFSINLGETDIGELSIISNHLQTINLTGAEVKKALFIDSLFVENYIGILNFDFPEKNTNASWYNLGGEKFAIFNIELSGMVVPYQAKTDKQLANNIMYNDLMSAYNKFNTLYHDRGNITSANASYVEIKNIETRKQAFIQKVNPSLNNLINYKLNVFLRIFSDYATNPGKALLHSILMILLFTIFYIFTFSGWDGLTYKFYFSQFNIFSEYISSTKTINQILESKRNKSNKKDEYAEDIKDLILDYKKRHKEIPAMLKLIGKPIYFISRFKDDIIPQLLNLVNFQKKAWSDLKTFEKIKSGLLITIILAVFILYVLLVKIFSSVMLSLNSFVVIGFGSLPESDKSLAMYLTIIEGIIGWFYLMIFTITLLSQVLQGA